jgi:exodeoxyribonuclease V alpha subunit
MSDFSLPPSGSPVDLSGIIDREVFRSETFAVLILSVDGWSVTIIGNLPALKEGESVSVIGKVVTNPKFGDQVRVEKLTYNLPASMDGVERFLGSGLIKGIGPSTASAVVKLFGEKALDILDQDPDRYLRVSGIGKAKLKDIKASWQEHKSSRDLITLLQQHDISVNLAARICKEYGSNASAVIRANPYQIAYDVSGVGFKRADSLARSLGFGTVDPRRIQAGLYFALNEAVSDGHVCLPVETLVSNAAELLGVDPGMVDWSVQILSASTQEQIVLDTVDGVRVAYLRPFYHAERGVASNIHRLVNAAETRLSALDVDDLTLDDQLSDEQALAVRIALTAPVSLITGGPGCGKSFLVKSIVDVLTKFNYDFALAAPTGRAAKRLAESTGASAQTIHRLLGLRGSNDTEPEEIGADVVIVDEMSMVDVILMNKLLKAVQTGAHLVLVGDADQLPSVGAGNILHDLIASGVIPVTHLTHIFRQAAGSMISENAHRINAGRMPDLENLSTDFYFFSLKKENIAAEVLDLVASRIPEKFGIPSDQVQVLTPMQKGENGVKELNKSLQTRLNPAREGGKQALGTYRVGDRVMQIKNNYDKGVYNGDMGIVESIDPDAKENQVIISYEGIGHIAYSLDELSEQIVLSYAITIHKSQGGEYPCALIILSNEHYVMLQRNLLYTAVTRARRLCILVGSRMAVQMAVSNNQVKKRHSGLTDRLINFEKEQS